MEVVYFELNNWSCGRDYPDAEPFISWMSDDLNQYFKNEDWVKLNKLVVVESLVDMSINYCITATKEWVRRHCPDLLTKYTQFLRYSADGDAPQGMWGCPFLRYKTNNIGCHFAAEKIDNDGFWCYEVEENEG